MAEQATIFYSWQSDLPSKTNRGLIEKALREAARVVHKRKIFDVEPVIDRDTLGKPGSPDILSTILKKIDVASVFVADVSIVTRAQDSRACPNPNVLLELGYALKALGDDRVIVVYNTAFGTLAELPFDLRGRRIAEYRISPNEQPAAARQQLLRTFQDALTEIAEHRRLDTNYQRNSEFATELISVLIRVQLYGNERDRRRINPWLERISNVYGEASQWLTAHSHEEVARTLSLGGMMEDLALLLDEVRAHKLSLGGGVKFNKKVIAAVEAAASLQRELEKKGPLTGDARTQIVLMLVDQYKRLAAWMDRARSSDLNNADRYGDLLDATDEIGFQLAYLSYFPVDWPAGLTADKIRDIGEALHLITLAEELNKHKSRDSIIDLIRSNEVRLRNLLQRANLLQ